MNNEHQDSERLAPLNPWDRYVLPDGTEEPDLWHGRFFRYMMSGTGRTVVQVCREEYKRQGKEYIRTSQSWRENAVKWHWEERARFWDDEQRRKKLDRRIQEIDDAKKRHVEDALALQTLGAAKINSVLDDPEGLDGVTISDARLMLKDGQDLERRGLGLPTHLMDIAGWTDEELRARYEAEVAAISGYGRGDETEGTIEAGDWRLLPPDDEG